MHGQVPRLPEGQDVVGVPPVAVELPVGELHHLADRVEEGVEEQVEPRQPDQVVGNLRAIANECWSVLGFAVSQMQF